MAQGAVDLRLAEGAKTAVEQNTRAAVFRAAGGGTKPSRPFDADQPGQRGRAVLEQQGAGDGFERRIAARRLSGTEGASENSSWLNESMLRCAARRDRDFAAPQDAFDRRDRRFDFGRGRFLA